MWRSLRFKHANPYRRAELLRERGARVGQGCRIHTTSIGSEPYLISIGDETLIGPSVSFITHDAGTWVFRKEYPRTGRFGRITIGSRVFVGAHAILLPRHHDRRQGDRRRRRRGEQGCPARLGRGRSARARGQHGGALPAKDTRRVPGPRRQSIRQAAHRRRAAPALGGALPTRVAAWRVRTWGAVGALPAGRDPRPLGDLHGRRTGPDRVVGQTGVQRRHDSPGFEL